MSEEQKEVQEEVVQEQDEKAQAEETVTEEVTEEVEADETVEESTEEAETTEEAPEAKPVERKVYTMPVAKAQEEKRRAVEKAREEARQEVLKEVEASRGTEVTASGIDAVAEKHGLDPVAAKELADAILAQAPRVDTSKYDALLEKQKIEAEKQQVADDFDSQVAPQILKDFPQATPSHIAKVKKEISELAFDARYNTYSLDHIYLVTKDQHVFKNSLGAESPGGKGRDIAKFKELSDEDEIKLADRDPAAYADYVKWQEGQHSRFSN